MPACQDIPIIEVTQLTLLAGLSTTNLLSWGWWWNSRVLPGTSEAGGASGMFPILLLGSLTLGTWLVAVWLLTDYSVLTAGLGGVSVSQGKPWGDPRLPVCYQSESATYCYHSLGLLLPPACPAWLDINNSSEQQVSMSNIGSNTGLWSSTFWELYIWRKVLYQISFIIGSETDLGGELSSVWWYPSPSHTSRLMSWYWKYQLTHTLATTLHLLWSVIPLPNVETADSQVFLDFFHVPETLKIILLDIHNYQIH